MILIRLIELLFKIDIRNRFSGVYSLFFDLLMSIFSLTIYWYTSKIFLPSVNSPLDLYKQDYFSYIVLGEIILAIPFYFVDTFVNGMKTSMIEGVFETLSTSPVKYKAEFWMAGMLNFPREVMRLVTQFLLAVLLFKMEISISFFTSILPLVLLATPAFLSLGYIFISIFLITGRGNAISGLVNAVFAFTAGAYFPLSLFPSWVETIGSNISPFTLLLENSRLILADQANINLVSVVIRVFFLDIIYGVLAFSLLKISLIKWKQSGNRWTSVP